MSQRIGVAVLAVCVVLVVSFLLLRTDERATEPAAPPDKRDSVAPESVADSKDAAGGIGIKPYKGSVAEQRAAHFSGSIVGRVTDVLAEPIAGADVWVAHWQNQNRELGREKTDSDGFFLIEGLPAVRSLRVFASAERCVEVRKYVSLSQESPRASVHLRLWSATRLHGRVVDDADGRPIGGATVCAAFDDSRLFAFDPQGETTTDPSGRFDLPAIPLGSVNVRAVAAGYEVGTEHVHLTDSTSLEVRLRRGEGIRIAVQATGLATPDHAQATRVRVMSYGEGSHQVLPSVLVSGRLDRQGTWTASGLPPDMEYRVSLTSDDYSFDPKTCTIEAGAGSQQLYFGAHADGTVTLRGRLRDTEGAPLEGEMLLCRAAGGGKRTTAVTGPGGVFDLSSPLAPGTKCVIYLVDSEYAMLQEETSPLRHLDRRSANRHDTVVTPHAFIELRAVRAARVTGRVTDATGRGIAFQRVKLQHKDERQANWMDFAYATTGRDGSFLFDGLRAFAADIRVWTHGPAGHGVSDPFELVSGKEVADVVVTASAPAVVEGTVRDRNGKPVPGARVWITGTGPLVEAITDRQGRYRHVGVVPGKRSLLVLLHGSRPPIGAVAISVPAGQVVTKDLRTW